MTSSLTTTIKIDNWDEQPTREHDDGTSEYVGLIRLEGELDGRSGAFTAIGEGAYDGTTASSTMRIVDGTGDLAGISGTVSSSSTQDDYPNMPLVIEYSLG